MNVREVGPVVSATNEAAVEAGPEGVPDGRVEMIPVLHSPEWDQLIDGCDGQIFASRAWMESLASTFELSFEAVVGRDHRGLTGGVPFSHVKDLRGERVVALPFSDFLFPKVDGIDQWLRFADELMRHEVPVVVVSGLDSVVASDDRFKIEATSVRHVISLDGELDQLQTRFSTLPRRMARRSLREGITYRLAENKHELRAFYDLHFGVRKSRYNLLCQPFELFETLWERFIVDGNGALLLAFDGSVVAGGCLLLQAGDTIYYKYAASHPDYRTIGVSHGAVVEAMRLGLERGFRRLDLGRSDLAQEGLVDFKRRFGADSTPLARFSWMPDLYQQDLDPSRTIQNLGTMLSLPEVPDSVTEQAGNLLYRYFA